jgi:hypothetical protein
LQLGTTKINEFVNVVDFYNKYILPDLQNADVNAVPVLKASGIKYLVTFRNQVTWRKSCLLVWFLSLGFTPEKRLRVQYFDKGRTQV